MFQYGRSRSVSKRDIAQTNLLRRCRVRKVISRAQCAGGTWVTSLAPPVDANTVLIYLSNNGWFLPDSTPEPLVTRVVKVADLRS